jgi:hypothetical protein
LHISVYEADEWGAVYLDGAKVHENHSICPSVIADVASGAPFTMDYTYVEDCALNDYVYDTGRFPDTLEEAADLFDTEPADAE